MDSLVNAVTDFVRAYGSTSTYWIAYSGGLDSHVLLHLFAKLRAAYPLKLRAVYINHGMSPHAAQWAEHCAEVCRALDVELVQRQLATFVPDQTSPEDKLRQARYQLFADLMAPNDLLLTAHHQSDQAETVLLQLLRGAGPKGLAAMPRIKPFAAGLHGRPLLDFARADLEQYAQAHQLHWVEDESNANPQFTRNFLRHQVMPVLMQRWPTVTKMLARSAEHCAQTQDMIEAMTQQDLAVVSGSVEQTLSVKKLLQLDSNKQSHVLRAWILQRNFPLPSQVKMQQILQDVLLAREDKTPHIAWGGVEIRRYRDNLYLMSCLPEHDANQVIAWDMRSPLVLPDIGELHAQGEPVSDVTVRFRQGGEVLQLAGRKHHHELKNLFQSWGVPPWQRERVPLIYVGEKLAVVAGFGHRDGFEKIKFLPLEKEG